MENLILIKTSAEYAEEICAYRRETLDLENFIHGSTELHNFENPVEWIKYCRLYEKQNTIPIPGHVLSDQFMLVNENEYKLLGLINVRRYLDGNNYLIEYGGHIGYSIRPSERRKGYAKKMLTLSLNKCRDIGLEKILITCNANNEASRRTILALGGAFERTTYLESENTNMERFWIDLI